jgi:8-oxo-dGTP diphosphatase
VRERVIVKVVANITKGERLLVFRHAKFPEAGIQVPAGTVEPGESLEDAVFREVSEETGLGDLELQAYLGVERIDLSRYDRNEIVQRHYFHLIQRGQSPAKWRHYEMNPSEGDPAPIEFELYWVNYPEEVLELAGGLGKCLMLMTFKI